MKVDKGMLYGIVGGGITSLFLGTWSMFAGLISLFAYLVSKKKSIGYFGITTLLCGFGNLMQIWLYEYAPSPMFFIPLIPKIQPSMSKITAFSVLSQDPTDLKAGDVWFNSSEQQFKGFNGDEIVILG